MRLQEIKWAIADLNQQLFIEKCTESVTTTVKEQRVDGSWLLKNNLRYTLLTIERCYITSLLSNRILTKRTFCSNNLNSHVSNSKLTQMQGLINPNQITGFADAEGAFMIKIRKLSTYITTYTA